MATPSCALIESLSLADAAAELSYAVQGPGSPRSMRPMLEARLRRTGGRAHPGGRRTIQAVVAGGQKAGLSSTSVRLESVLTKPASRDNVAIRLRPPLLPSVALSYNQRPLHEPASPAVRRGGRPAASTPTRGGRGPRARLERMFAAEPSRPPTARRSRCRRRPEPTTDAPLPPAEPAPPAAPPPRRERGARRPGAGGGGRARPAAGVWAGGDARLAARRKVTARARPPLPPAGVGVGVGGDARALRPPVPAERVALARQARVRAAPRLARRQGRHADGGVRRA